jgi:hypothetical protein
VVLLPIEMVYAFVDDRFSGEFADILVVDSIDIVASGEELDGSFSLRRVVEQYVRMRLEYNAIVPDLLQNTDKLLVALSVDLSEVDVFEITFFQGFGAESPFVPLGAIGCPV